ncbi:MAG TPA: acylphosphatase [Candidatus Paceibacterota bacterium]|nr:acylphosphatase [Candidatus Paceibacterota bacterium]
MNERIEAVVSGRVQLVMYRDFACRKARALKLVGEVKNLTDGTVSVIAEGSRDVLRAYIEKLRGGSILASVESVSVSWFPATGEYKSFDIVYE